MKAHHKICRTDVNSCQPLDELTRDVPCNPDKQLVSILVDDDMYGQCAVATLVTAMKNIDFYFGFEL